MFGLNCIQSIKSIQYINKMNIVESNDFQARFFSNSSIELYPESTLSEWAVEFNNPLILDERYIWHVGVSQIWLNPSTGGW